MRTQTSKAVAGLVSAALLFALCPLTVHAQQDVPEPSADAEYIDDVDSDPCANDDKRPGWIDRVQYRLYRLTCSSASWFDGLFGNRRFDQEYRQSHGFATLGTRWSERDGVDPVARFRARMNLPQISNKLNAFVGRIDQDEFVTESSPEGYALPAQFASRNEDDFLVGLGYRDSLSKTGSFDTDVGVRVRWPPEPYVKGSYRYARPIGQRNLLRLRETAFWRQTERFGVTSSVDWDHAFDDRYLLRWSNAGTFSQVSEGVRWYSELILFHSMGERSAFAYQTFINGSSDAEVPLSSYGATVTYRQRVWREWLIIELQTGVDWPRYELTEERKANWLAGLAFELRYGQRR